MRLERLIDKKWKANERKRFTKATTKIKTDDFDPEEFRHDGFDDREKFVEEYVPALADTARLEAELTDFRPPRLSSINDSPYQALVIRHGVLRNLIQQPDYKVEKGKLLENVQAWQRQIIENFGDGDYSLDDDLLHLAKACVDYGSDVDDSELHLVYSYFELRNRSQDRKHDYYTWLDFFKRLSAIDRFPKVSRSEKPEHVLATIEKGVWSLQEQAIVFEIVDPDDGDVVGIPEDYADYIRDWLYYEMSDENFRNMLESLAFFDKQANLVEARATFDVHSETQGYNEKRRESLVKAGIFPSELLDELMVMADLQAVVDRFGLDAHRGRRQEMIDAIIDYFEHSQKYTDSDDSTVERYLKSYDEISDGNVDRIPPQVQQLVPPDEDQSKKLDILFEQATAELFREAFGLEGTTLKGQSDGGIVADGEVEQDGDWLLWDNKRRTGEFKLGSNTQSKIKTYIDTKSKQHGVKWFVIIAPEFSDRAERNAIKLEKQVGGIDVRLVRSADFKRLAEIWIDRYSRDGRELPLSVFYGSGEFNLESAEEMLEIEFS